MFGKWGYNEITNERYYVFGPTQHGVVKKNGYGYYSATIYRGCYNEILDQDDGLSFSAAKIFIQDYSIRNLAETAI